MRNAILGHECGRMQRVDIGYSETIIRNRPTGVGGIDAGNAAVREPGHQVRIACNQRTGILGELNCIADMIAMDRTTLASNLKPLAREGLVTVETSAADRRARIVTLTADGLSRMKAALPLWKAVQARFEESFGADDAARLRASLGAVLDTGFDPWAE